MAIVCMGDIFKFIGEDFMRPFVAGNKLLKAKHLFDVCLKVNPSFYEAFALCLAMSNIQGPPHQLYVKIYKDLEKRILGTCSCKAGRGAKCKHIAALLLKLESMDSEELKQAQETT